jgi:predicted nuclease with TOPRIM domain
LGGASQELEEELAKVRAEQEPLRRKNLKLEKEVRDLKVRMDEFAEELAPSAILRWRCASPVSPERVEDMEVDVVGSGGRRRS